MHRLPVDSSAQSLNEDGVISQYERQFRRLYSRKHVERLRLWLNNTILHEPIDDLITGLPANYGRCGGPSLANFIARGEVRTKHTPQGMETSGHTPRMQSLLCQTV